MDLVGIPWGNPGYVLSETCGKSFTDFAPLLSKRQI
jgi:hypothetical protein